MPFDSGRFVYSLAGRLIAGEWSPKAVRANLLSAFREHRFRSPRIDHRVLAAFASKPAFERLAAFLQRDVGLLRAMSRSITTGPSDGPSLRQALNRRTSGMESPPARLEALAVPKLTNEAEVAAWFEIEPRRLLWLADVSGRNRRHPSGPLRVYRHRWMPRRGRAPRLLEIPGATLKRMQRKILAEILNALPAHPAAHGFCPGRSIVTNAAEHCGKATVLRFDLRDFFPSVTSARVFRIFRTAGYPADVSRILMGVCTTSLPADVWDARPGTRDGDDFILRQRLVTRHLPQGAPTSPALANLAAHRLDRRLAGLARAAGAAYTRYADDLTFSGGPDLSRARKRLAAYVALVAGEEGFALNFRKTRILRAGVRQHVTGVVVNVRPNLGRDEYDRLKAILTNCVRHGLALQNRAGVPDFRAHLAGKVSYFASIHPARGAKLRRILAQIARDSGTLPADMRKPPI